MYAKSHKTVCTCRTQDNRRDYGCHRSDSVCEAREGQQKKLRFVPAEDAMIRPVVFSRSYWLRRRTAIKHCLLQLYYETGVSHNVQSGSL